MTCTLCPLHTTAQSVCIEGDGPLPCDILIVGDAPGTADDNNAKAFSGVHAKMLRDEVAMWPQDLRVRYTHVVRCKPPGGRKATLRERKTCATAYLYDEIRAATPHLVVALGANALHTLLGGTGIIRQSGHSTSITVEGLGIVPVYICLPYSYIADHPQYEGQWRRHVKSIPAVLRPTSLGVYQTVRDAETIQNYLNNAKGWVSFNYETTGLNPYTCRVLSVAVSTANGDAICFDPILHPRIWRTFLGSPIPKVVRNIEFEGLWSLVHFDVEPCEPLWDTKLFARLQDENLPSGLKQLALELTEMGDYGRGAKDKMETSAWAGQTIDDLTQCNGADADATLRIQGIQQGLLVNDPTCPTAGPHEAPRVKRRPTKNSNRQGILDN